MSILENFNNVIRKIDCLKHQGFEPKSIIMNNRHALEFGSHICVTMEDRVVTQFIGYPVIISDLVDEIQVGV